MNTNKKIKSVLRKISEIEWCGVNDVLDNHKHYFNKYNIEIPDIDIDRYKKSKLEGVKKPLLKTKK